MEMDFWTDCPDDILITIFKNFDLKTRLKANQTCQRWYELLKDPRARMEDVDTISLKKFDRQLLPLRVWQNTLENIVKLSMDGLTDHVKKAGGFRFEEHDSNIASFVSRMINDGRLKINRLSATVDYSIVSRWINAIMPSSIRELNLGISRSDENASNRHRQHRHERLICDWSRFPRLERLSLYDTFIDLSSTAAPVLKYLNIREGGFGYNRQRDERAVPNLLNGTLPYLSNLEDLRFSDLHFDEKSVHILLRLIKEKLTKLRFLQFQCVNFELTKPPTFDDVLNIDFLKEIQFEVCFKHWVDVAKLFLHHCASLDITNLRLSRHDSLTRCLTETVLLINKSNTRLELSTDTCNRQEMPLSNYNFNVTKLFFRYTIKSELSVQKLFCLGEYENLIEIKLEIGGNEEMLKFLAQSCLSLKKLDVSNDRMIENGLKYFLIHWNERRSKRLSITFEGQKMENLFGTSFEEGRGVLDERWMMEEKKDGSAAKRRKKTSTNEKRWMIFRKESLTKDGNHSKLQRVRLVIWDHRGENNSDEEFDQKILIIKNYNQDMFVDISVDARLI